MNRKSQVQAVHEVFAFAIGLSMMISITYLFTEIVYPPMAKSTTDLNMENINAHIDTILAMAESTIFELDSAKLSFVVGMPEKIQDYLYYVKIENKQICSRTSNIEADAVCQTYSTNSLVSGSYTSGGRMEVKVLKTDSGTTITIGNEV